MEPESEREYLMFRPGIPRNRLKSSIYPGQSRDADIHFS